MGQLACNKDPYQQVLAQYGPQFKNHIIQDKCKAFLGRQIDKVKNNVSQMIARNEKVYMKAIEQAQKQVQEYYEKVKKELNQRQPGGIQGLQQMSKSPIEVILGYDQVKLLFEQFKHELRQAMKIDEEEVLDDLSKIVIEYQQQSAQQQSKIVLLNQIPENERQDLFKRGEMDLQHEILKTQEYILDQYSEQMNIEYLEQRLLNINCRTQLLKLVNLAKDKLLTGLNLVLSETIGTYILIK